MFNMCTKFHENTFDRFNGIEGTGFPYKRGYNCHLQRLQKLQQGHNSIRNVGADMVFVLRTPFDDGLYLNQNCKYVFSCFKVQIKHDCYTKILIPIKM